MKRLLSLIAFGLVCSLPATCQNTKTMKDVLGKYFYIGAAVSTNLVWGRSPQEEKIVKDNYNSVVAENCMKGEVIHPKENTYFWDDADQTVKFAEEKIAALEAMLAQEAEARSGERSGRS